MAEKFKIKKSIIKEVNIADYQKYITNALANCGINLYDVFMEQNEQGRNYTFIEILQDISEEYIMFLINFTCRIEINS